MDDQIHLIDLSDMLFYVCPQDQLEMYQQTKVKEDGTETESNFWDNIN